MTYPAPENPGDTAGFARRFAVIINAAGINITSHDRCNHYPLPPWFTTLDFLASRMFAVHSAGIIILPTTATETSIPAHTQNHGGTCVMHGVVGGGEGTAPLFLAEKVIIKGRFFAL